MWSAFPASDYYGPSAPPHSRRSTVDHARHQPGLGRLARRRWDGSHVHQRFGWQDRRPAMPLQPRHEYAAGLPRGLPGYAFRLRSHLPTQVGKVCTAARPRSARFEPVPELEGVQPPVHSRCTLSASLAGPGPSGSAGPSRRCQGRFPPDRRTSTGPAALSFKPGCCDSPAVGPSTPPESLAPRGARRRRGTGPRRLARCRR